MTHPDYVMVGTFHSERGLGDRVAVFPDCQGASEEEIQSNARNTAPHDSVFLFPPSTGGADADVRMFALGREQTSCVGPLMAAAVLLSQKMTLATEERRLNTPAGLQKVSVESLGPQLFSVTSDVSLTDAENFKGADMIKSRLRLDPIKTSVQEWQAEGYTYLNFFAPDYTDLKNIPTERVDSDMTEGRFLNIFSWDTSRDVSLRAVAMDPPRTGQQPYRLPSSGGAAAAAGAHLLSRAQFHPRDEITIYMITHDTTSVLYTRPLWEDGRSALVSVRGITSIGS